MTLEASYIERLKAINPPVFRIVGGAADFASLVGEPKATPAAYVMVEEEQSGENQRMTGPVLQRTEADIAVIVVTHNVSDGRGGAAAHDIANLKPTVRKSLVGFVPDGVDDAEPTEHVSSNLLKAKNGHVWQRELFGTAYTQEEAT